MPDSEFAAYLPLLKNIRLEWWISSRDRYACYVYGYAVMRNGKIRRFKSKETAIAAGEAYLAYAAGLTGAS